MSLPNVGSVIGTGVTLGIVHVLTGPDHLSALATLSANERRKRQACLLGIHWGLGHAFGLVLVGSIFIAIDTTATSSGSGTIEVPHSVEKVFETLVGVFMLLLGAYGFRQAWKKRPSSNNNSKSSWDGYAIDEVDATIQQEDTEEVNSKVERGDTLFVEPTRVQLLAKGEMTKDPLDLSNNDNGCVSLSSRSSREMEEEGQEEGDVVLLDGDIQSTVDLEMQNTKVLQDQVLVGDDDIEGNERESSSDDDAVDVDDDNSGRSSCNRCRKCFSKISTRVLSFCIGVLHGLAGPGGVLGVIPAVQLHNWKLALLYLTSFCLSSIVAMGTFALLFGTISSKLTGSKKVYEFRLECFSAGLSVLVGIVWLVLAPMDKLGDVFG